LSSGESRSIRCGQDRLNGRGDLEGGRRGHQAIGAPLPRQSTRFHQAPDALFEEERVALGALDQTSCERQQLRPGAEQGGQEFLGDGGGQRIDVHARVVRPAQPTVIVFRAIAHDEQGPLGQGADHDVECAPRLLVGPLQILEHQDHWPGGALALINRRMASAAR
jgi:hypothetical protein